MFPVSAADERDSSEVLLEDAVKRQGFQGVGLEPAVGLRQSPWPTLEAAWDKSGKGVGARWVGRGARQGWEEG